MAKQLFGILNGKGKWCFYPDGKLMAYDDARIAIVNQIRLTDESAGGPFEVKEIGFDGQPYSVPVVEKAGK